MHLEIENIHHPQIKNMNLSVYDVGYRAAHLHPEIELILVLKGDPAFNINGNTTSFSEKDIILINANELHEIISEKAPSTLLSLHILPQYFEGYFPQMSHISFLENTLLSKNERLFTYSFCKLLKIYLLQAPYYQLECAGLLNIMVHDILQSCAYYEMYGDKLALTTKRNSQLSEIIGYIEEHSAERVTLSDLAKHMQLSASYLSHFIQKNLHRSFSEFLTYTRYLNAKALLMKGELSLIDICYGCGFSDYRYMNNAFKKYTGQTPNEFKKNMNSDSLPHNKKGTVKSYTPQEMLDTVTRFMENNHFNEHQI